jgi:phasin family protein
MATKNGNPFENGFTKLFETVPAPQFDVDAFAALQQSNIDALGEVNKVAADGLQEIAKRQAEMVHNVFAESSKATNKLVSAKPDDRLDTSATLAKTAFDSAVANFQELADLAIKSQTEIVSKLSAAYTKNVDEMQVTKPVSK